MKNDEALSILLNIRNVLETSGAFQEFNCAPDECGLPFVFDQLNTVISLLSDIKPQGCNNGDWYNPLLH